MSRAGRKRKAGKRTPSGQLSREGERVEPTAQLKIRKAAFQCDLADPIEMWAAQGSISRPEGEALALFRSLCVRAWGAKHAKTGSLQEYVAGDAPTPMTDDKLAAVRKEYEAAREALDNAGVKAVAAVERLIYSSGASWPDARTVQQVKAGAAWLMAHFRVQKAA